MKKGVSIDLALNRSLVLALILIILLFAVIAGLFGSELMTFLQTLPPAGQ